MDMVVAPAVVKTGAEALVTLKDCVDSWQTNKTERARIKAALEACLAVVHANRDIVIKHLSQRSSEREKLYEGCFGAIQTAMKENRPEDVRLFADLIKCIFAEDPLKGLSQISSSQKSLVQKDGQ